MLIILLYLVSIFELILVESQKKKLQTVGLVWSGRSTGKNREEPATFATWT
jgi:hypothetical protein